jgi:hypothetical protein
MKRIELWKGGFDGTLFMVVDTARNGHRGRAMSLRGRMVTFHAIDMVKRA